jgi:acyl dehydratase
MTGANKSPKIPVQSKPRAITSTGMGHTTGGEECAVDRAELPNTIVDLSQVQAGQRWLSGARTLNEHELGLACMLSADWHPIHADARYAAASALGQRVFQGGYGVMLALGMATRFPAVGTRHALALGLQDWQFRAPLFVGDTVHVAVELTELRRTSDGRRVVLKKRIQLIKHDGQVAQEGQGGSLVELSAEHGDQLGQHP